MEYNEMLNQVCNRAEAPEEVEHGSCSDLLERLADCARSIEKDVEDGEWEQAADDVARRERLLHDLSHVLENLEQQNESVSDLSDRRRIRWMLEDIQAENNRFIEIINDRLAVMRTEIHGVKRGRKALGLYRRPHPEHPRFLNRIG